ncbi:hypothetical protein [Streptomyces sp. NRRL WC-3744]|uniref:hypothetical protein n=1 Tax=Streptomyces sp. NRRL WC-3744 TaxID=1463935 RepID=UPI000562D48C|nr:hypothetical protein [Streptomyces sp. NRRL WC-3744]
MTSSLIRGRPRRATAHIRVRVAHAVLGALVGAGWLVLPVMTVHAGDPVPVAPVGTVASAAAPQQGGTSTADLVLPLVAGVAAVALAGYGYLRRTRRARTRTTPGIVSTHPPVPAPADSERQARAALRLADDCVRTSREELSFVRERFGEQRTEPFTHALRAAETELSAAFAIWRRYEEGVPEEAGARRQALVGVIGRCAEAGRRLDAEAEALDRLRGLTGDEEGVRAALGVAEERFRELAARTTAAQRTLTALRERYAHSATGSVTGYVELAKDRLVFAGARLNEARQAADVGETRRAAWQLRAGEGAVAQAGLLVDGVERLADQLREAAGLVPAALTGAESKLATARRTSPTRDEREARPTTAQRATDQTSPTSGEPPARPPRTEGGPATARRASPTTGEPETPPATAQRATDQTSPTSGEPPARPAQAEGGAAAGEPGGRPDHADGVLAAVREELTGGAYDPLDALRRITRAVERQTGARSGVLDTAALLVARSSVAGAEEFVGVHRGAVGAEARARLAEAVRELGAGNVGWADVVAGEARRLADRDVRTHGTEGDAAGLAGAVLGGVLLGEDPDGGPPPAFGGPGTRSRLHT